MSRSIHNTVKLPKQLLAQLGIEDGFTSRKFRSGAGPKARKDRRKAARVEKNSRKPATRVIRGNERQIVGLNEKDASSTSNEQKPPAPSTEKRTKQPLKSALKSATKPSQKATKDEEIAAHPKISRGVKDRLAADDAEIQALERALGVKNKSKLPKAFEDEGLGDLLEGLDGSSDDDSSRKRKRGDEGIKWLQAKRRKAQGLQAKSAESVSIDEGDDFDTNSESATEEYSEDGSPSESEGSEQSFSGFDDEEPKNEASGRKKRENPYIAPSAPTAASKTSKYVPPSLRESTASNEENLSQLRRQVQGLLNRLSDANLVAILGDVEKLYRSHPRQHVSSTLTNLLSNLIFDPSALQDTFIILHAGFVSAVFKIIGADLGALMIQQSVAQFDSFYETIKEVGSSDKRSRNLIAFLAHLYSFQVVGSNLIYDLIRLFLENISEENTELLLKIVQSAGPQLRQDDPSSLKDIVYLLQSALACVPPEEVSVRTKFIVETVNDLKNNRMKTGLAASSIASEHVIRMKKILGSLNTRSIKASEPLRIGLKDIRDTDKRGKWWLVGAGYRDEKQDLDATLSGLTCQKQVTRANEKDASFSNDLLDLAKAHRMNTDIRRSIFITIMSATDYRDAHIRLLKLRLKKAQELEIPKVLLHCAIVEETYNPYYTLVARKLCADRKLKMSFQFALWDAFKRMTGDEDEDEDVDEGGMNTKEIVHLARIYGTLVADGGLTLSILKPLNMSYLAPKAHTWLELFSITVIVQSQKDRAKEEWSEAALKKLFEQSIDKERPETALELRRFLQRHVRKTDIAGGKEDRRVVKWGVDVLGEDLRS